MLSIENALTALTSIIDFSTKMAGELFQLAHRLLDTMRQVHPTLPKSLIHGLYAHLDDAKASAKVAIHLAHGNAVPEYMSESATENFFF